MPLLRPNISAMKRKRDVASLLKMLKSEEVRTRREAIRALGEIGDQAAIPALTVQLTAEDVPISEQLDAAKALGKITDPRAMDALLKANVASIERELAAIQEATTPREKRFRDGFYVNRISADEYTLRSAIAAAMGRMGGAQAVNALFEMLAMEKGPMESSMRDAIRQAIAQTVKGDDESHARILLERLRHESKEIRHWAAHCLRGFHGPQIANTLMNIVRDEREDFSVREAALGTLGKISDANALADLDELACGSNRAIARLAAHGAIEIRQRRQLSNEQT